jgi:hypothetical protein
MGITIRVGKNCNKDEIKLVRLIFGDERKPCIVDTDTERNAEYYSKKDCSTLANIDYAVRIANEIPQLREMLEKLGITAEKPHVCSATEINGGKSVRCSLFYPSHGKLIKKGKPFGIGETGEIIAEFEKRPLSFLFPYPIKGNAYGVWVYNVVIEK